MGRCFQRVWEREQFDDALFIDLKSMKENKLQGSGMRLVNTKEGVQLAINRNLKGTGNIKCHIFTLSDTQFKIMNNELAECDVLRTGFVLSERWLRERIRQGGVVGGSQGHGVASCAAYCVGGNNLFLE